MEAATCNSIAYTDMALDQTHQDGNRAQVTLVAKIVSIRDGSSDNMMKMVVYDGTGSFNVEHYLPQDDEQVCSITTDSPHLTALAWRQTFAGRQ